MESPRNHWKPGTFSLIIAHDKTFFEVDIHLVDGGSCLTVTITICVINTNRNRYSQARTAIDQMDIHFKKRLVVSNY